MESKMHSSKRFSLMGYERRATYYYSITGPKNKVFRTFEITSEEQEKAQKAAHRWVNEWLKLQKQGLTRNDVRLTCTSRTLSVGRHEYQHFCSHCGLPHWGQHDGRTVCPRCNQQEYEYEQAELDRLERQMFPAKAQLSLF